MVPFFAVIILFFVLFSMSLFTWICVPFCFFGSASFGNHLRSFRKWYNINPKFLSRIPVFFCQLYRSSIHIRFTSETVNFHDLGIENPTYVLLSLITGRCVKLQKTSIQWKTYRNMICCGKILNCMILIDWYIPNRATPSGILGTPIEYLRRSKIIQNESYLLIQKHCRTGFKKWQKGSANFTKLWICQKKFSFLRRLRTEVAILWTKVFKILNCAIFLLKVAL